MITFFLMNLMVMSTAYLLVSRALKIKPLTECLIGVFLVYLSQIVVTEMALGIFGQLYLTNIILLNFIIFLWVYFATRNLPAAFKSDPSAGTIPAFLQNKIILFLISIILVFGLVKIAINLVNPPFGWDSLNYHFTFAVEWLKNGNLNIPITICDDPSPSYYPINGSLFYLWLMFPLRNVFLADLGQLPFFILGFLAVYDIARKIGLAKNYSFYAAALFLIIPNFFKQLSIAYVDVMVASLFLTCVLFLFSLQKKFSAKYVLFYSLSLGLLLGTKTIAFPYSALLILPFVYLCFKNMHKAYLFFIVLAALIVLGGFTYMRNFFETGNPLYPLNFSAAGGSAFGGKLSGITIFKGVIDSAIYGAHFKLEDYRLTRLLFHEGLGVQALIFILPGIFLALLVAIIERRKSLSFNLVYFLILPVLVYLVYRYLIPLPNVRYLYALLGMGMVLGFYAAEVLSVPRKIVGTLVVICAITSMAELAKRQELVISIILTLILFFLSPYLIKVRIRKKVVFGIFSLVFIFFALILLERVYLKNEFPGYKKMVKYSGFWPEATVAWAWLNTETSSNNIAYVGRPVAFPLYGTNFKNNVYYVSVNKTDPAKLHYFLDSHYQWGYDFSAQHKNFEAKGNYRSDADYSVWLGNLLRRDIDYLFVYSSHQTKELEFPMEDIFAKEHPERFKPVFTNKTVHIYRIIK